MVGHLNDAERIFTTRAFRISRGDKTPQPAFDENVYAVAGNYDARSLADLMSEFAILRRGTLALYLSLSNNQWTMMGVASETNYSVRAIAWATAGHFEHHMRVVEERYLPNLPGA